MVRQLREVLNRHSTNDHLDPEEEMLNVIHQKRNRKKKRSTNKKSYKPLPTNTDDEDNYEEEEEEEEDDTLEQMDDNSMLFRSAFYFGYDKRKKQYGFGMGKRTYQDFLKMIQEEKNLLDLKRVRNDIVTQIRKKRAQIGNKT